MKKTIITLAALASASASFAQISLEPGGTFGTAIVDAGDGTYNIVDTINLAANTTYILERPTFVTNADADLDPAVINIAQGAIVRGQPEVGVNDPGILFICRDGEINAIGTSTNPVIFTTAADATGGIWTTGDTFLDADPKTSPMALDKGRWGAIVMLGNAPINTSSLDTGVAGEAYIEGTPLEEERVTYGGSDVNDSSGVLEYVSIRYSGQTIVDADEVQGLTLGGVGYGTKLENIEIFGSDDDGIEIFGGTASVKNLLIVGHDDDGFDGDHGWTGFAQFVCIVNSYGNYNSDHAIELDGDDTGALADDEDNISDDGRPFASGHLANFTIIGISDTDGTYPGGQDTAVRFRRGFGGSFKNSIISGFQDASNNNEGLELDNDGGVLDGGADLPVLAGYPSVKVADRVEAGTFNIAGTTWFNVGDNTAAGVAEDSSPAVEVAVLTNDTTIAPGAVGNLIGVDPQFGQVGSGLFATDNGGIELSDIRGNTFNPVPNPSVDAAWKDTVDLGSIFFEETNYRGAFAPATGADLWTTGWTAMNVSGVLTSSN